MHMGATLSGLSGKEQGRGGRGGGGGDKVSISEKSWLKGGGYEYACYILRENKNIILETVSSLFLRHETEGLGISVTIFFVF